LPGSPFNPRRGSRGSHQFTLRTRGRFSGVPSNDRKPLVLQTYLDAQEHLPYADDSNAVTPMSEENGAIIVPVYYPNLGSRHSSYTSHQSRISYTSHGDLLGGMTKESRLRGRSRNHAIIQQQPTSASSYADTNHKGHREYVKMFCKYLKKKVFIIY
jgi:voltage-gated sodium channel type II alpha